MSKTKKQSKKVKKVLMGSKKLVRQPKFKLVSYTMKAVIPTGQYANIQPEVTVKAKTFEDAERAVMPYIETLFARYRDGGVRNIEAPKPPVAPVKPAPVAPKAPVAPVQAPVAPKPQETPAPAPIAPVAPVSAAPAPVPSAIVMTVPFTRAKGAIDSCTSLAALKLVTDQVEKSTKLVEAEKVDLRKLSATKLAQLNGGAK